jgi:LacI family transcriptional regulator, fructose operon transcriptional repressor
MTVGIKEVARVAGVSPATVSRVLGQGPVSESLRARVEAAIRATGYRPNLSARRLRSRHSRTIGLIVADIRNPFFTAVSRAVEDEAYRAGLRVILCNTDENPDKEAMYLRLMEEERVTGLIFAPTRQGIAPAGGAFRPFPTVLIDRAAPDGQTDAVVLDNRTAARTLVQHLHAQGYRRIMGLFGNASATGRERHDGYRMAMEEFGLSPDAVFIAPSAVAAETALRHRIVASRARPDATLASNGLLLMGVVRGLRAAGLAIPGDMAVAGFDNDSWTELAGPGITVIAQPVEAIGRTAMRMLLERLNQPDAPVRKAILDGCCIVRGSTAPRSLPSAADRGFHSGASE